LTTTPRQGAGTTLVVVARFVDTRRAARMAAWMRRAHISSRLDEGPDGRMELAVRDEDEARALDLLLTIFWGLELDHMHPEPPWQRARTLENAMLAGAIGLIAFMVGLLAWWTVPVMAVIPIQAVLGLVGVVVLLVAFHPGPGYARRRIPGERGV
jgi:hypothetical protein